MPDIVAIRACGISAQMGSWGGNKAAAVLNDLRKDLVIGALGPAVSSFAGAGVNGKGKGITAGPILKNQCIYRGFRGGSHSKLGVN